MSSRFYYTTALVGYFGLLFLLLLWTIYLVPPTIFPISIVLIFYVGPLLIPLRGLLYGKLYTHAWAHFMALFYFTIGVMVAAANAEERWYALIQVTFSIMMFVGSMMYVRVKAREKRADQHVTET